MRSFINQYKRQDVFRCVQDFHAGFENQVSVYHVLKEKGCFPEGCIYFRWRCRLLNKGEPCPKKFRHVGRICFGCRDFYDEKLINSPRLLLEEAAYRAFQEELLDFESWLDEVEGREVNFTGTVDAVKPMFRKFIHPGKRSSLKFEGFLVAFGEGYFDYVHFEDRCYLRVGRSTQRRQRFARGDRLDFYAKVRLSHGRLVLKRPRRLEVEGGGGGEGEPWTEGRALVAMKTGTTFKGQPERCIACDRGVLIDVEESAKHRARRYRQLFCLEGEKDSAFCRYAVKRRLAMERCLHDEEGREE